MRGRVSALCNSATHRNTLQHMRFDLATVHTCFASWRFDTQAAQVVGWDVSGRRVVCICVARPGDGDGGRREGLECSVTACDSVLELDEGESVLQVVWRPIDALGGIGQMGCDQVGVLTTERVVVVAGNGCARNGEGGGGWHVVGEMVEQCLESVMWVGHVLSFTSSSCLRILHLPPPRHTDRHTPDTATYQETRASRIRGGGASSSGCQKGGAGVETLCTLETLCTFDTCGGVLAGVLSGFMCGYMCDMTHSMRVT